MNQEYTVDPISGKSRINRGELPQYWCEDTHEAIIPLEVYQAVQAEKARRRELGVFANWSINTSCFTSRTMRKKLSAVKSQGAQGSKRKLSHLDLRYAQKNRKCPMPEQGYTGANAEGRLRRGSWTFGV